MLPFAAALADAGGLGAPRERLGQLRGRLEAELARGADELARTRSGYGDPVVVAAAGVDGLLLVAAPVSSQLRADPDAVSERAWLLVAALVGALVEAAGAGPGGADRVDGSDGSAGAPDSQLTLGPLGAGGATLLALPAGDPDAAELVPLAFEEQVASVDRLRTGALAVPGALLADDRAALRPPIGARHPLVVAEAVARLGGRPADPASIAEHEEAVLGLLGAADPEVVRPHDDPDPARRVARRIVQRLAGMGKWGGYHTDFSHLARGFQGNDRQLAEDVGERLLAAGLLVEKPSVGQRHVFLNPRRAADVYALVERGSLPAGLTL